MLAEELKDAIEGEVLMDDTTLAKCSEDYSVFKIRPELVVCPKTPEDVKQIVRVATQHKQAGESVSLTGRAAGTDMSGGPLNESVIVSFTEHMNRIRGIGADYAVVEPGLYFRDLEPVLDSHGLMYPSYPASKNLCALGGIVSNNSGGEKTLRYGQTKDYVRAVRVVLADGEEHLIRPLAGEELKAKLKEEGFEGDLYRAVYKLLSQNYELIQSARPSVSKNSCGYLLWDAWDGKTLDLTKLITGSQGTLGLLTEATIGLVPKEKHQRLVVVFLRDLNILAELVNVILPFKPESVESYDDKTLSFALRFLPDLVRSLHTEFLPFLWSFYPEAWMTLRGGLPKMVLLIEMSSEADDPREIENSTRELIAALSKFKVQVRATRDSREADKYWTIRRQSFKLLHDHTKNKVAAPFVDDIIVRPEFLPEFLPKVNAIFAPYRKKLVYTIAGHVGNGNFHIIPLVNLKDPETRKLLPRVTDEVYRLVLEYHGSLAAEHNDGLIRTPYLSQMFSPEIVRLFKQIKDIFDPLGIFNPGKKVGGSMAYSWAHLK